MAEYRISIYGRKQSEWDQLASWFVNNELYSENVIWLIQVIWWMCIVHQILLIVFLRLFSGWLYSFTYLCLWDKDEHPMDQGGFNVRDLHNWYLCSKICICKDLKNKYKITEKGSFIRYILGIKKSWIYKPKLQLPTWCSVSYFSKCKVRDLTIHIQECKTGDPCKVHHNFCWLTYCKPKCCVEELA